MLFSDLSGVTARVNKVVCGSEAVELPQPMLELPAASVVVDEGTAALEISDDVVLVSNIAAFFNETSLRAMMGKFGAVVGCVLLPADAVTQKSSQALVQFSEVVVARRVVEGLTEFVVGGLLLRVAAAPAALVARYFGKEGFPPAQ